jgi:hypothetical protein
MNAKRCFGLAALLGSIALAQFGHAQQAAKFVPTLEPVAETKLIMAGLAHANFKGLERILTKPPADAQAWTFARGQALLIAETANLLMIRPPRNSGETAWMERATVLRNQASQLAQAAAKKDFERARTELEQVAGACNRCHQNFRVPVQIEAFADPRGDPAQ